MKDRKSFRSLFSSMKREWLWILKYVKLYKLNIFLYIALGLVATGMSLGTSVATKRLIDAVVNHSDDKILSVVCLVVGLTVLCHVFQALASWVTAVVSTKTNNEIRQEIYSNVVTSNWEDISSFHSGDLLNRLEGDASTVSSGIIGFIPNLITRSVQFFGALAIVLYYDKTMAVLALMSAPILFASSRFLLKTMRKFNLESRELNGKVLSFSEESMQNIQVIKAFDLTKQYTESFKLILENYRKVRLNYEKFSVMLSLCLSLLGTVVAYSCYGWGVYRLWQGAITYGTMTLFLSISGTLNSSFNSLASLAPSAVSIATAAGRIMEITGYEKEKDEEREKALLLKKRSASSGVSVNFEDVSFTFKDADEPVLRDICFSVSPGETIALIGPSGEGKTTVLKLILGLLKPQKGRMYIEGESSQQIDISDSTRRFCSYVPQSVN
ncbi:MAG: ABC transporter transmembrane domain-containing protein, partial [Acutalibacteraceae bacterium]